MAQATTTYTRGNKTLTEFAQQIAVIAQENWHEPFKARFIDETTGKDYTLTADQGFAHLLRAKPGMRTQEVKFNWAEAYDTGYLSGVAVTRIENFLTHSAK